MASPAPGQVFNLWPISKQRNAHLQTVLIEAAKLAPRWNKPLAELHERELKRGDLSLDKYLSWMPHI